MNYIIVKGRKLFLMFLKLEFYIQKLSSLEELSDNYIFDLGSIDSLPNLKMLILSNNPISKQKAEEFCVKRNIKLFM